MRTVPFVLGMGTVSIRSRHENRFDVQSFRLMYGLSDLEGGVVHPMYGWSTPIV